MQVLKMINLLVILFIMKLFAQKNIFFIYIIKNIRPIPRMELGIL